MQAVVAAALGLSTWAATAAEAPPLAQTPEPLAPSSDSSPLRSDLPSTTSAPAASAPSSSSTARAEPPAASTVADRAGEAALLLLRGLPRLLLIKVGRACNSTPAASERSRLPAACSCEFSALLDWLSLPAATAAFCALIAAALTRSRCLSSNWNDAGIGRVHVVYA